MSRAVEQIREIGRNVERLAGKEVAGAVMEGSENITGSTPRPKVAAWVNLAMKRLDKLVKKDLRSAIMMSCGENCARHNSGSIEKGKQRRAKFRSEKEFLDAELQHPQTGTRLELKGRMLVQYDTPRSFHGGMRCYCSLMGGLPTKETASATYCQCSRGFAQTYWQGVLGRPVEDEVKETCLTGASECRFVIHL